MVSLSLRNCGEMLWIKVAMLETLAHSPMCGLHISKLAVLADLALELARRTC